MAGSVRSGVATNEHALSRTQRCAVLGFEFYALPHRLQALVVCLVLEVTQIEFGGALVRCLVLLQAGAPFFWGVVKHELVVAACTALAGGETLGFDARE